MDGKKIGILSGTIYNQSIKRIYQESEYSEYQTVNNLIEALKEKEIDGFVIERPMAIALSANNEGITYINESVIPGNTGIIFSSKKENLLKEFNEFLQKCKEDGYLDYLDKKWVIANCAEQINDSFYLSGDKGTIHAITSTDLQPFSFVNSYNGIVSGFEVDLIKKFCYEYDYNIDIKTTEFENVINSVKNNEYDIGFASIAITNDRKKELDLFPRIKNLLDQREYQIIIAHYWLNIPLTGITKHLKLSYQYVKELNLKAKEKLKVLI